MITLSEFALSFGPLVTARIGVGFGRAKDGPAGASFTADCFRAKQRTAAMGISALAIPIGATWLQKRLAVGKKWLVRKTAFAIQFFDLSVCEHIATINLRNVG